MNRRGRGARAAPPPRGARAQPNADGDGRQRYYTAAKNFARTIRDDCRGEARIFHEVCRDVQEIIGTLRNEDEEFELLYQAVQQEIDVNGRTNNQFDHFREDNWHKLTGQVREVLGMVRDPIFGKIEEPVRPEIVVNAEDVETWRKIINRLKRQLQEAADANRAAFGRQFIMWLEAFEDSGIWPGPDLDTNAGIDRTIRAAKNAFQNNLLVAEDALRRGLPMHDSAYTGTIAGILVMAVGDFNTGEQGGGGSNDWSCDYPIAYVLLLMKLGIDVRDLPPGIYRGIYQGCPGKVIVGGRMLSNPITNAMWNNMSVNTNPYQHAGCVTANRLATMACAMHNGIDMTNNAQFGNEHHIAVWSETEDGLVRMGIQLQIPGLQEMFEIDNVAHRFLQGSNNICIARQFRTGSAMNCRVVQG